MPYVQLSDMVSRIPNPFLVQALDDSQAGLVDQNIWAAIQTDVGNIIDGRLGQRYATPFTGSIPLVISEAAKVFAAEMIYDRRQVEPNPYRKQADAMREKLDRLAIGQEPLSPTINRADPSGAVIGERSQLSRHTRVGL